MKDRTKGPLLVCTGSGPCRLGRGIDGHEVLLIDTDRRTFEGTDIGMLIGEEVVRGEGAGGNLNLARACYRKHMEDIGARVLGRPLVVILADAEGATSVAGAVEINSLLTRVSLPSLVILMTGRSPTENSIRMTSFLMDGPLRPAAAADLHGSDLTPEDLLTAVGIILKGSSRSAGVQVSAAAWNILRENGGPYRIELTARDPDGPPSPAVYNTRVPSVMVMEVDPSTTTSEINEFLNTTLKGNEGVHLGIVEDGSRERGWKISVIAHSPVSADHSHTPPQGEMKGLEGMLSSVDPKDMSPDMIM